MNWWTTTPDLMAGDMPAVRWIVDDFLPEGLAILIGRQKLGKSQLALNLAIAVETGGMFLGYQARPGSVLYCDLELGQRRVRQRLESLGQLPSLSRLAWVMPDGGLPRLGEAFYRKLDQWRDAVIEPALVIVDIAANIMPAPGKGNAYVEENKALAPLRDYANAHHIAIVLVHHTKQGDRADPLEKASGSNAMTSVPNQAYVLDGKEGDRIVTLYARGHDITERKIAISRDDAGWFTSHGDAAVTLVAASRRKIIDAIQSSGTPMHLSDIALDVGLSYSNVRQTARRMVRDGQLMQMGKLYAVAGGGVTSHKSESKAEKPLRDKAETTVENVTPPESHSDGESHIVTEDVTPVTDVTISPVETVTSESPSTAKDSPMNVTPVTDDLADRFLGYLVDNHSVGIKIKHRDVQQRLSPDLSGEDIRGIAPSLAAQGLIEIPEKTKDDLPAAYVLTKVGYESIKGPSLF